MTSATQDMRLSNLQRTYAAVSGMVCSVRLLKRNARLLILAFWDQYKIDGLARAMSREDFEPNNDLAMFQLSLHLLS